MNMSLISTWLQHVTITTSSGLWLSGIEDYEDIAMCDMLVISVSLSACSSDVDTHTVLTSYYEPNSNSPEQASSSNAEVCVLLMWFQALQERFPSTHPLIERVWLSGLRSAKASLRGLPSRAQLYWGLSPLDEHLTLLSPLAEQLIDRSTLDTGAGEGE